MSFEYSMSRMVKMQMEWMDDVVLAIPEEFMTEPELRAVQELLETRRIVVLPPGRVISEQDDGMHLSDGDRGLDEDLKPELE